MYNDATLSQENEQQNEKPVQGSILKETPKNVFKDILPAAFVFSLYYREFLYSQWDFKLIYNYTHLQGMREK